MSFLDKLKVIRDNLCEPMNRDYEFEAEFTNHPFGSSNIYRLHFLNYHRIGENYGMAPNNLAVVDFPYTPFMLPEYMNGEEAFKVLSYLTDFIESTYNLKECSQRGVKLLNEILDMGELGFTKVDIQTEDNIDINDLFTVTGRIALFKDSKYYSKYFEWYTEGVTLEDVIGIYEKYGREFSDLILKENLDKIKKRCLN